MIGRPPSQFRNDARSPGFRGDPKFGYYFAYFRDPDGHKFAVFNITPQA